MPRQRMPHACQGLMREAAMATDNQLSRCIWTAICQNDRLSSLLQRDTSFPFLEVTQTENHPECTTARNMQIPVRLRFS